MRSLAYYNEVDPYAAQWLRNLVAAGHIARGFVDERSIEDVRPSDLSGFAQCHFFAGVGVWSYALRLAGWPDEHPVWTGSCPCQPFSAAGKGAGFDDERHLWPAWHWLIEQCKPSVVFGEQVASKAVDAWIDLVQTDLEALGYGVGAVAFPSAGVGAPHIRDRTFWVADASDKRLDGWRTGETGDRKNPAWVEPERFCNAVGLVESKGVRPENRQQLHREHDGQSPSHGRVASGMVDSFGDGRRARRNGSHAGGDRAQLDDISPAAGPTNGLWGDADWLFCRDGKWRPVEPGTFPLANGATSRVGRLRGYGNAINAQAAKEFINAYLETRP